MSFELLPIRGSTIPLACDRRELADALYEIATNSTTTMSRGQNPMVGAFLLRKRARATVERLAVSTDDPKSPVVAYAVHREVGISRTELSGLALLVRGVDVFHKEYGSSKREMVNGKRSVCMTFLGSGGVAEIVEVNRLLIGASGQGNEIAIEPKPSCPLVHEALRECYPGNIEGSFVLGLGRVNQISVVYGLTGNDLTRPPSL
ncbi:hypothetical protein KBB49_01465 [Candidatus Saccharibacteria bacterium]|nr:hypothetical protein [Candidatus Saccharibacteria bacterium]